MSTSDGDRFDFVIVGSGAGGGPLAPNLAEAGFGVLLLEAGDWDGLADLVGDPSWSAERRRGYFERLERWQPPEDTDPADSAGGQPSPSRLRRLAAGHTRQPSRDPALVRATTCAASSATRPGATAPRAPAQSARNGDPMAVLDRDFHVRGVEALRVVDASGFPHIPGTFLASPST